MDCPNCKLVNPANATRCDCGYDFQTHTMQESHLTARDKQLLGHSAGFVRFWGAFAGRFGSALYGSSSFPQLEAGPVTTLHHPLDATRRLNLYRFGYEFNSDITPIPNRRYDGKVMRSWKLWLAGRRARREIEAIARTYSANAKGEQSPRRDHHGPGRLTLSRTSMTV